MVIRTPARSALVVLVALAAGAGTSLALAPAPATADEGAVAEVSASAVALEVGNDADGDGTFSDVEEVPSSTAPVPFRVAVTNLADVAITVTDVVDVMEATTLDLLEAPYCPGLAGELAPGGSSSCTFTLDRYLRTHAQPPRDELVNVVKVTAAFAGGTVTATDDSTVVNPNAGRVAVELVVVNDADGDGDFTADEQAVAANQDVPFRVTVRNTSPGTAVLRDLVATWDGQEGPRSLFGDCPDLEGIALRGAGEGHDDGHDDGHDEGHEDDGHEGGRRPSSVTCTAVLEGHAPAAGSSRTTTISATLAKGHAPDVTATATAVSTVSTPAPVVVPPRADVDLAARVGPPGGPYADHDVAPGLRVDVSATGATVMYELEVVNVGETALTEIVIEDDLLVPGTCRVPTSLDVGESVRCLVGPVAVSLGEHVHEATVRARGSDQSVSQSDAAWYQGVTVDAPVVDEPEPAVPAAPVVEVLAGAVPPAVTSTSPATLPRTGTDTAPLAVAGFGALLGGALLLGASDRRRNQLTASPSGGR